MMERSVHEVGLATIAAVLACAFAPLVFFANELVMHGPGAFPVALSMFLFGGFIYLFYTLPTVYLMLPLLAFTRGHGLLLRAAAVVLAPVVVVVIYASPTFTWEAMRPLLEHVEMTAALVTISCILYYVVARWIPQR